MLCGCRSHIQQLQKGDVAEALNIFLPDAVQSMQEFQPETADEHKSLSGFVVSLTDCAQSLMHMLVDQSTIGDRPDTLPPNAAALGEARHQWNRACAQVCQFQLGL